MCLCSLFFMFTILYQVIFAHIAGLIFRGLLHRVSACLSSCRSSVCWSSSVTAIIWRDAPYWTWLIILRNMASRGQRRSLKSVLKSTSRLACLILSTGLIISSVDEGNVAHICVRLLMRSVLWPLSLIPLWAEMTRLWRNKRSISHLHIEIFPLDTHKAAHND